MTERKRYRLNVLGDFYVEDGCCTMCGVPEWKAPALFASDGVQCFVSKQPTSLDEMRHMLGVLHMQDLGCVRYAGNDPNVVETIRRWRDLSIVDASWLSRIRARLVGRPIDLNAPTDGSGGGA